MRCGVAKLNGEEGGVKADLSRFFSKFNVEKSGNNRFFLMVLPLVGRRFVF